MDADASGAPVSVPGELPARIPQLEHELRLAAARFAGVVEISADAIVSVDERLDVIFFNEGAERTFGYRAIEVIGRPLDTLLPERFRANHNALVRAFGAGAEPVATLVANAVDVLRPLATAVSLTLESDVPGDLPPVYADPARVQQVLSNLVGNSIKFTPKAGRIAIAARIESASEVRISVRDTGPGMPPDQLPHVFGAFWQGRRSDRRGVGLGLAIVKSIVDAHDGRVWVESQVNVGSEFVFTLPVAHD